MIPILYILPDSEAFETTVQTAFDLSSLKGWERIDLPLEKQTITIESVRQFIRDIQVQSNTLKLAVIPQLHTARRESQNALLKLIEEVGATPTQLVAYAEEEYSLIPTLRSRFRIEYGSVPANAKSGIRKKILRSQTLGQNLKAGEGRTKAQALEIIADVIQQIRGTSEAPELIHDFFDIYGLVSQNNINPEFALDSIALRLSSSAHSSVSSI